MRETQRQELAIKFGGFIRKGRMNKNLTQGELAAMLGVTQSYYNRIEVGNRNVDLDLAMVICEILELDLNEFVQFYQK